MMLNSKASSRPSLPATSSYSAKQLRHPIFINSTGLKLVLKTLMYYCADLKKSSTLGFNNREKRCWTDNHEHLKVSQVWLSGGRHVYMSKPLKQLELYHQVITFLNEYMFLNAAVKLVISDILIEGAPCWIHLLKMLLHMSCANECTPSISCVFYCVLGKSTCNQIYQGEKRKFCFSVCSAF